MVESRRDWSFRILGFREFRGCQLTIVLKRFGTTLSKGSEAITSCMIFLPFVCVSPINSEPCTQNPHMK